MIRSPGTMIVAGFIIVNANQGINVMGCRTSATKNISAELGAKSTLRLGLVCLKTPVGKSPLGIADVCS